MSQDLKELEPGPAAGAKLRIPAPEAGNAAPLKSPRRHEQAKEAVRDYIRVNRLNPGTRLPTEESLCRQFGWSRATVARALNDLAGEGTLNRIQGSGTYVASPKENRRAFRVLVSSPPPTEDDDYCAPLFAGLRHAAAEQQVQVVYSSQVVPARETVDEFKADGVVALSWRIDDLPRVLALHEAGIRVVGLALRSRSHTLPLVCTDNFGGACQVVEHLLAHGHRRIAYTCVNLDNSDIFERLCGVQYSMARAGLPMDPSYLQVQSGDKRRAVPFLEAWWRSMETKPTAIIMDTVDGPAMLNALARLGVRVPEEVSIVLIDERGALRHHWPPLTYVRQPIFELGQRGLTKLLDMLRGEDAGLPEVLPTELILQESVQTVGPAIPICVS